MAVRTTPWPALLLAFGLQASAQNLAPPPPLPQSPSDCANLKCLSCPGTCGTEVKVIGRDETVPDGCTFHGYVATLEECENYVAALGGGTVTPRREYDHRIVDWEVTTNGTSCPSCGSLPPLSVRTARSSLFTLRLERIFQSRLWQYERAFGTFWQHNYDIELTVDPGPSWTTAVVSWPGGMEWRYVDVGNTGTFTEHFGRPSGSSLAPAGSGYLLVTKYGEKLHFVPMADDTYADYRPDWIEDRNGFRLVFRYDQVPDGIDRLVEVEDGYGRRLQFQWGRLFGLYEHIVDRIVLPDGRQIAYVHTSLDDYRVTYPNGDVSTYVRGADADGPFWAFNDARGTPGSRKHRVYTYPGGIVRGIKDVEGRFIYVSRDMDTRTIQHEYASGRIMRYRYNDNGFPLSMTNLATGATMATAWDELGHRVTMATDWLGRQTSFSYSGHELARVEHPDGATENFTHSGALLTSHRDALGHTEGYAYDGRGNLTRIDHADGTNEQWTYTASGLVASYRDRNGRLHRLEYDAFGNVSAVVLPDDDADPSNDPRWQYVHDLNGNRLAATDPEGRMTAFHYDALDRLVRTVHPDGTFEEIIRGSNGQDPLDPAGLTGLVVGRRDRNGNATAYGYDRDDRRVQTSDALGVTERLVYAPGTDLVLMEERNGDQRFYTYDGQGRRISESVVASMTTTLVTTYAYDDLDRVTQVTDPYGFRTITVYDDRGRVEEVRREHAPGAFAVERYAYDAKGRLTVRTDAKGHAWTSEYDAADRLVRSVDPLGHGRSYTYDGNGNQLTTIDEEGHVTATAYTARNRVRTRTDGSGVTTATTWYRDDQVKDVEVSATGSRISHVYGCCGRLLSRRTFVDGGAGDIVESFTYDGNGNPLTRTDGEGRVWTRAFDVRNREVLARDPLGTVATIAWFDDGSAFDPRLAPGQGAATVATDANGNTVTSITDGAGRIIGHVDAAGHRTTWTHDDVLAGGTVAERVVDREGRMFQTERDGLGRTVRTIDASGFATVMTHDPVGNLLSITDSGLRTTHDTYDAAGRRISRTASDGGATLYSYGDNGWLRTRRDANGSLVTWFHDGAGRKTRVRYPDATEDTFAYDGGGRLTAAATGLYPTGFPVSRTYDPAGRIVRESQRGHHVDRTYDRRGLTTSITLPAGVPLTRTWTPRGELDRLLILGFSLADQGWDAGGRLISRSFGNGTEMQIAYDTRNRMTELRHRAGPADIHSFRFVHDLEGNRLSQEDLTFPARSEIYALDASYRLTDWRRTTLGTGPDVRTQSWVLDPVGNWVATTIDGVTESRLHSAANELHRRGPMPLTYDANGNLLDDGTLLYAWDFNDRLKEVRRKSDGALVGLYAYDAFGRRVARLDVPSWEGRFYFHDGDQVVEERDLDDRPVAGYVWGNSVDDAVARLSVGAIHWYHPRALSSPVALTDQAGNVVERYAYDAYGEVTTYDDAWSNPLGRSRVGNPLTFTGRPLDPETGLIHLRARSLQPAMGRMISRDPLGVRPAETNAYAYAAGDPIDRLDPFGLSWTLVSGDTYNADNNGATLGELAVQVGAKAADGVCIWPVASWYAPSGYPTACKGDQADVSNLTATVGRSFTVQVATDLYDLFSGIQHANANVVAGLLKGLSDEGGSPIGYLVVAGHSGVSGVGNQIGTEAFTAGGLAALSTPTPSGTAGYNRAVSKKGPVRCWFTRSAEARFPGCMSYNAMAVPFSTSILRVGAIAWGTIHTVYFLGNGKLGWPLSEGHNGYDVTGYWNTAPGLWKPALGTL